MSTLVRVDSRGRLAIPATQRRELGINPGDYFIVEADEAQGVLRFIKAENAFEMLAAHAIDEYKAGRTISLHDFAQRQGFSLDEA